MFCENFAILQQCIIHIHPCFSLVTLHSFREIKNVIIVIKRKEYPLWRPYRTRARPRVMGEVDEVQERIKADIEALKGKMTTMMEAMMSMNNGGQCSCSCRY